METYMERLANPDLIFGLSVRFFGVFNYKYKGLGEIAILDELLALRKKGIRYVDLGGSDGSLLKFKKKFKPVRSYTTHVFSIVKR